MIGGENAGRSAVRQMQQFLDYGIGLEKAHARPRTDTSSINFSIPMLNTGGEADSFEA